MMGSEALKWACQQRPVSVLDVGSGEGHHARIMKEAGHEVVRNSLIPPAELVGDYMTITEWKNWGMIWCCHCLEHVRNPGAFLEKIYDDLAPNGYLVITVPPAKHEIVGGHVSLWNMGLLFYHLILAGFDCSKAKGLAYGYNISVIVQKTEKTVTKGLIMDAGDIEKIAHYFPFEAKQGFDGNIERVNWDG